MASYVGNERRVLAYVSAATIHSFQLTGRPGASKAKELLAPQGTQPNAPMQYNKQPGAEAPVRLAEKTVDTDANLL